MALAPMLVEFIRGFRDDARKDREERDRRMELLLERVQKAGGPGDMLTTVLDPIMKWQQKRSALEMESFAKNHQELLDEVLKTMRDNRKEETAPGPAAFAFSIPARVSPSSTGAFFVRAAGFMPARPVPCHLAARVPGPSEEDMGAPHNFPKTQLC